MKTCLRCGKTKRLVEFHLRRSTGRPRGPCAKCEHELRAIYRRTPEGRASDKRAHDKYYRENRNKVLDSFKTERFKETRKRYNMTEKASARIRRYLESEKGQEYLIAKWQRHSMKRRLRIEQTSEPLTVQEWRAIKAAYQNHCAYCDVLTTLAVDHVIPLSRGGSHNRGNVAPACWNCNNSKRAKLGWEPRPPRLPLYFPTPPSVVTS